VGRGEGQENDSQGVCKGGGAFGMVVVVPRYMHKIRGENVLSADWPTPGERSGGDEHAPFFRQMHVAAKTHG
jgi:hypothetical protein